MQSWIVSIITPVFSVTHAPSEIMKICWFAQEMYIIIINGENSCAASYFWGKYFFHQDFFIESKKKKLHFIWIKSLVNYFTVTFNEFNASF